jgi:hypothetical protein
MDTINVKVTNDAEQGLGNNERLMVDLRDRRLPTEDG